MGLNGWLASLQPILHILSQWQLHHWAQTKTYWTLQQQERLKYDSFFQPKFNQSIPWSHSWLDFIRRHDICSYPTKIEIRLMNSVGSIVLKCINWVWNMNSFNLCKWRNTKLSRMKERGIWAPLAEGSARIPKIYPVLANMMISRRSTGNEIWLEIECTIVTSRNIKEILSFRPWRQHTMPGLVGSASC